MLVCPLCFKESYDTKEYKRLDSHFRQKHPDQDLTWALDMEAYRLTVELRNRPLQHVPRTPQRHQTGSSTGDGAPHVDADGNREGRRRSLRVAVANANKPEEESVADKSGPPAKQQKTDTAFVLHPGFEQLDCDDVQLHYADDQSMGSDEGEPLSDRKLPPPPPRNSVNINHSLLSLLHEQNLLAADVGDDTRQRAAVDDREEEASVESLVVGFSERLELDDPETDAPTVDGVVAAATSNSAHQQHQVQQPFGEPAVQPPPRPVAIRNLVGIDVNQGDILMMQIYEILQLARCSRQTFDLIVGSIQRSSLFNERLWADQLMSRDAFVKRMCGCVAHNKPTPVVVALETRPPRLCQAPKATATVVRYGFLESVRDLLCHSGLTDDLDNLVVNEDDPFAPYRPTGKRLDEIQDGAVFQHVVDQLVEKEFAIGLILYCDKTGKDHYQRNAIEPHMFTLTIFKRSIRNMSSSWRLLSYLPNLDVGSSAKKEVGRSTLEGRGMSIRNYHQVLRVSMQEMIHYQKNPPWMWVQLGGEWRYLRIRFPVVAVLGDGLNNDHHCGRVQSYSGTPRLCWLCMQDSESSDGHEKRCKSFPTRHVHAELTDQVLSLDRRIADLERATAPRQRDAEVRVLKTERTDISKVMYDTWRTHRHVNAYREVWFGNQHGDICDAMPPDMMHAFLLGVVRYVCQIYAKSLTPTQKARLDDLVERVFASIRSGERKFFPRMNFTKGFTNMTLLTAHEWAGVVLVLLVAAMTLEGQDILRHPDAAGIEASLAAAAESAEPHCSEADPRHSGSKNHEVALDPRTISFQDFVETMEMLLSFYAWYKRTDDFAELREPGGVEEAQASIGMMIRQVTKTFPRKAGNGWRLPKLHVLLHVPSSIAKYGSPSNWDCGVPEHNMKDLGKTPAVTAQMRTAETFTMQTAERMSEMLAMQTARNRLPNYPDVFRKATPHRPSKGEALERAGEGVIDPNSSIDEEFVGLPKYQIQFHEGTHLAFAKWLGKRSQIGHVEVHPLVLSAFSRLNRESENCALTGSTINCYTELWRGGVLYRAHPNYHSDGEWYEWANTLWDDPPNPPTDYPGKLLCFYVDPREPESRKVLVHSTSKAVGGNSSVLVDVWNMAYGTQHGANRSAAKLEHVDTQTINGRVFVVQERPGLYETVENGSVLEVSQRVLVIKPMDDWGKHFM